MGTGSVRGRLIGPLLLAITLSSLSAKATVIHRGEADRVMHPCEVDADCPPGFGCPDPSPQGMEGETTRSCLPRLCEGDGDCDGATVCILVEVETCSDGEIDGAESTCEPVTEQVCGPLWLAPCEADADCGDPAMSCMEKETCTGGHKPRSEDPDREEIDENCEPLGVFHCEFDILPCAGDGDCPESWGCIQAFGGEVSLDFEIPCPEGEREGDYCLREGEPGEEGGITHVCLPDGYADYIGWTGGAAPRASTDDEENPEPRREPSADEPTEELATASDTQAGCGGGRNPGGFWWVLLALVLFSGSRRLKVDAFDGAMTVVARDGARCRLGE